MVIKGRSISHAKSHARHLVRQDQNSRIELLEVDETAPAPSLEAIFEEYQALAIHLTKAKKGLYIAALNPEKGETLTPEQWKEAVDTLAKELGLQDQPRTVVLHECKGREHVHVVWQRADIERGKVIDDQDNYLAHERASRQIEKRFDLKVTKGVHTRDNNHEPRPEGSYQQWEHDKAKRSKIDLNQFKADVLDMYHQAENGLEFAKALEDQGFYLGRGDKAKKTFMIITPEGDDFRLPSTLKGIPAKEWKAKLSPLKPEKLKPVSEIRHILRNPVREAIAKEMDVVKAKYQSKLNALITDHGQEIDRVRAQHRIENKDIQKQRGQDSPKGVMAVLSYITGTTYRIARFHAQEDRERTARYRQQEHELTQAYRNQRNALRLQKELALHAIDEASKGDQPALKLRFEISREEQVLYDFEKTVFEHDRYTDENLHQYDDLIFQEKRNVQKYERQIARLDSLEQQTIEAFAEQFEDGQSAFEKFKKMSGFTTKTQRLHVTESRKTWDHMTPDMYRRKCISHGYFTHKRDFFIHKQSAYRSCYTKAMKALMDDPTTFGKLKDTEQRSESEQKEWGQIRRKLIEPIYRRYRSAQIKVDHNQARLITARSKLDILENKRLDAMLDFSDKRLAYLRRIQIKANDLTADQFKKLSKPQKQTIMFAREHMDDSLKRSLADDYIKQHDTPTRDLNKSKDHDKPEPHI